MNFKMKIYKFWLEINLFLIIQTRISHEKYPFVSVNKYNCLIHNVKYSNEYLYASNNIFRRDEILQIQNPDHNIYTIWFESIDDYNKLKWTIEKMDNSNDTSVTIRSNKGEYLCASNLYHDLFHRRRKVYLKGRNKNFKKLKQNCQWRLEQDDVHSFIIWNDYFVNEKLYAPSFFYKYNSIKRYVYLWKNEPATSSEEFKWFIDCGSRKYSLIE